MGEMPWTCSPLLEWRFLVRFGIGCCTHDILHNKSICFFCWGSMPLLKYAWGPRNVKTNHVLSTNQELSPECGFKKTFKLFPTPFPDHCKKKNMVRKRIKKGFYCIFETFIQGNILSSKAGIVDRPETST